jgi:Ankyrin repeats (3 copies)/Ankyrin repeat
MLRPCFVLLIFVGMLEPAFACSIISERREIKVETVQGLGGDCYYKRIPQNYLGQNWDYEESWLTEFYANKDDVSPVFKKDYYFQDDIVCLEDEAGLKRIGWVDTSIIDDVRDEGWLEFLIYDQIVRSYALIDVIGSEMNAIFYESTCGSGFEASRRQGFVLDEESNRYVYEIVTLDNHIVRFDLLTGDKIPTEQPLDGLLADALIANDFETVKTLLTKGVDPNIGNQIDGPPIYLAVKSGNIEIVEMLLKSWADPNVQDARYYDVYDNDHNPVYAAVKDGNLEILQLLWAYGADVNQLQRLDYQTYQKPLDEAIANNRIDIVRYLLERGADFSIHTLEIAKSSGSPEMLELVLGHTPR